MILKIPNQKKSVNGTELWLAKRKICIMILLHPSIRWNPLIKKSFRPYDETVIKKKTFEIQTTFLLLNIISKLGLSRICRFACHNRSIFIVIVFVQNKTWDINLSKNWASCWVHISKKYLLAPGTMFYWYQDHKRELRQFFSCSRISPHWFIEEI